jgi:hypothetical protein
MKLELQKPGTDVFSHLIGILNGIGAGQWFNEIVISSRARHAKPDRRIFAALCRGMAWTQTTPPIYATARKRIFAARTTRDSWESSLTATAKTRPAQVRG